MNLDSKRSQAFHVWLNNKEIDIVFFNSDCTADYVKQSLINHDNYSPDIKVYRRAWNGRYLEEEK